MTSEIVGYVRLTAADIRKYTSVLPKKKELYEAAIKRVKQHTDATRASRSILTRWLFGSYDSTSDWRDAYCTHVPYWIRFDNLESWDRQLAGFPDDTVVHIGLPELDRLRTISEHVIKATL